MPDRLGSICAYLDYSIPEVRGDQVHFTASSGGNEMQVCMSRHEALRMAHDVIRVVDEAGELGGQVLPFVGKFCEGPPGKH